MKNKPSKRRLFIWIALAAVALLALLPAAFMVRGYRSDTETPLIAIKPNNTYSKTIVAVADIDYSPYSFIDKNGLPSGHDVELIYALANQMGVNVNLRLVDWKTANEQIVNGEADIILGMVYNPQLHTEFDLTIPLNNDPFVAFSKKKTETRIDLFYSSRLATLHGGIVNDAFISPYHLEKVTTLFKTYSEAFMSVERGENDYVIAPFSVGRRNAAAGGFADLVADGPVLFNGTNCMAVKRGNAELLEQTNKNLLVLLDNGTTGALKHRWLGEYVQVITFTDYLASNFYIVLSIIVLFVAVIFAVFAYIYHKNRVTTEASLRQKAEKDQLTDLFNKTTTENLIKQAIFEYDNAEEFAALLIIDVDNFKNINDTLGHLAGDIVLSSLADKLKTIFRTNDIIGRIGGDEFFVFMKNVPSSDVAIGKAKDINKAFRNTYRENTVSCTISASIGIAFFPAHGSDFDALYKNADTALYITKENGKDAFTIYDGQKQTNYRSGRTEIDARDNLPQKSFKENRIEYLFKLLYGARDTHAIQSALELVSDHFSFSRGYIFEIDNDEKTTSNTHEWCKEGIAPEILNLQKIPLDDVSVAIGHLVSDGKFIMKNLDDVSESERAILEPQGIKSMFHFGIFERDALVGFVGFDDCVNERTLTAAEIDELSTICNLLAVFVSRLN